MRGRLRPADLAGTSEPRRDDKRRMERQPIFKSESESILILKYRLLCQLCDTNSTSNNCSQQAQR